MLTLKEKNKTPVLRPGLKAIRVKNTVCRTTNYVDNKFGKLIIIKLR